MAVMIREQEIDVDITEELEPYLDQLSRWQIRGNKIQACSPFRDEKSPSFAVNLDNGTWIDSGAYDEDWRKGNITKLLAYFMGVTYGEAEDYLIEKYRTILSDVDSLVLEVQLEAEDTSYRVVEADELKPYMFRSPYLGKRGISEKVQKAFKVGFDNSKQAIMFSWMDKDGKVINLKFRSIKDKRFWYLADGQGVKQHIYGLHFFHKMTLDTAYAVESETDALYLWSHGIPAIAFGSASMSKQQEKLLIASPIKKLIIATDNDTAGNRFKSYLIDRLQGSMDLFKMHIPNNCKDVNDIPSWKLKEVTGNIRRVIPSFL